MESRSSPSLLGASTHEEHSVYGLEQGEGNGRTLSREDALPHNSWKFLTGWTVVADLAPISVPICTQVTRNSHILKQVPTYQGQSENKVLSLNFLRGLLPGSSARLFLRVFTMPCAI
jgi:hypothetical protein